MKVAAQKIPCGSKLIPKLFSSVILRRAGRRQQPARYGRRVDSWLVFCLTRMSSPGVGRGK